MSIKRKARSLELFFVDGDPEGMLTATVPFQWTGHILLTSRTQLREALKREEAKRPGVYLLFGEGEDGEPLLYIGESDDIGERIKTHDTKKDWWTAAVFVTSNGEPLNKAHARYLESKLVEKANSLNKIKLDNLTAPSCPALSEAAQAHMEDFLDNIYLVLPALKFDCFVENTRGVVNVPDEIIQIESPVFITNTPKSDLMARARIEDGHFVVESGSKARKEWVGHTSKRSSYGKLFGELISQGVLVEANDHCIFAKSYAFNSPSAAGAVVKGRPTAGPTAWKIEGTNKTYKEWENEQMLAEMM